MIAEGRIAPDHTVRAPPRTERLVNKGLVSLSPAQAPASRVRDELLAVEQFPCLGRAVA